MASLKYSLPSLKELEEIKKFIAEDSELYARRFIQSIRLKITILKNYPEIGKPVFQDRFSHLRQILYQFYRIIYHVGMMR